MSKKGQIIKIGSKANDIFNPKSWEVFLMFLNKYKSIGPTP